MIDPPHTILNWSEEEIRRTNDPHLYVYAKDLKQQYEELFEKFLKVVLTHSKHFPEKLTYELFLEAYNVVTTRCFGWGLPATMIVPFADFLNHTDDSVYHYMFKR